MGHAQGQCQVGRQPTQPKRGRARSLVAATILFTVVATAPMEASAALADCPSTGSARRACLWDANTYGSVPNAMFQNNIVLGASSNSANSVANYLTVATCYYDSGSFTSFLFSMNQDGVGQSRDPNLTNGVDAAPGVDFSNRVSSARVC